MSTHMSRFAKVIIMSMSIGFTSAQSQSHEWAGTQYFTFWELGQSIGDISEVYPGCFTESSITEPPPSIPCMGIQYFFPNCSYGISLKDAVAANDGESWLVDPWMAKASFQPLTNASQQSCYCSGDYWQYVRSCNACLMEHGYEQLRSESSVSAAVWLPAEYVDEQSSSYCSGSATAQAIDFFAKFSPTSVIDHPSNTAATTIASTATAVAEYATLTATVSDAPQTSQTGSLSPTAAPTATSTSAADSIRVAPISVLFCWSSLFLGFVGLLI